MINLSIAFSHPDAISQFVQYARIDNLAPGASPVFTTVSPNPITSPTTIAMNVLAGQYQINASPVYADGRKCAPTVVYTPACDPLISFSAAISGNVMVITYVAPSTAPKIRVNINYPNGGSFAQNYVNDGNPISIGLPPNVFGNFTAFGQSVCDESSGFYSAPSASVNVPFNQSISGTFALGNSQAGVCGASITTLYTPGSPVAGTTLYTDANLTIPVTGYSLVLYQGVIYNLSGGVLGSDSGLRCTPSVRINSTMPGVQLANVIGIVGFTPSPSLPMSVGGQVTGNHAGFTGTIQLVLTGTPVINPSNVNLTVNGVLVQCLNVTGGGSFTFASATYQASDTIVIALNTGSC